MFNEDDKVKDNQSFGLFSFMNEQSDKDDSELTDLQKEAIQKGEYDPWDFEEDEVDDDSYYSEDDEE